MWFWSIFGVVQAPDMLARLFETVRGFYDQQLFPFCTAALAGEQQENARSTCFALALRESHLGSGSRTGPSKQRTLYLSWCGASPFCCCSRILTTSKGVTMTKASVMPAEKPAAMRRASVSLPARGCRRAELTVQHCTGYRRCSKSLQVLHHIRHSPGVQNSLASTACVLSWHTALWNRH